MSLEMESPAGRKKMEWERKASSTREKNVSKFCNSEELKQVWMSVNASFKDSLKRSGIPLEDLTMEVKLTTTTQEVRKRRVVFTPLHDSLEMAMERSERRDKWEEQKLKEADEHHYCIKRTAYYCTINKISTRARDGLLSASGAPVSGSEVKEMLKQIDAGMERHLPLRVIVGIDCAYISPLQLVDMVVKGSRYDKPTLEVVFSGDGRCIRKTSSIAFFLKFNIDEKESRKTKWVFPIVIGKGREKAENLEEMMKVVVGELSQISGHVITLENGKKVETSLKVCADGKFLLSVLGMKGANGSMSCPFCMLSKSQWALAMFPKFQIDPHSFARKSLEELFILKDAESMHCSDHQTAKSCKTSGMKGCGAHGQKKGRKNLLEGLDITLKDIVLDELHMFMRLFEHLLDRLLYYIEVFDLEEEFEKLVRERMKGVTFHLEDGETEEGLQCWSPLNGEMSWKLLHGLLHTNDETGECIMADIFYVGPRSPLILPEKRAESEAYFKVLKFCFSALRDMFYFLHHKEGPISTVEQFGSLARKFCQEQIKFFGKGIANGWYFHMLGCHLTDILQHCNGSILRFSCSAQERVNGIHAKMLMNCVMNQKSSLGIMNLMRRTLYFEFFDSSGAKDAKNQYPNERKTASFLNGGMEKKMKMDQIHQGKEGKKKKKGRKKMLVAGGEHFE
jgi:hypothetical protein